MKSKRSLKDLPDMTVEEHHVMCIGVMAECFKHVPFELQQAIHQGCIGAMLMGLQIEPSNLWTGAPLHTGFTKKPQNN